MYTSTRCAVLVSCLCSFIGVCVFVLSFLGGMNIFAQRVSHDECKIYSPRNYIPTGIDITEKHETLWTQALSALAGHTISNTFASSYSAFMDVDLELFLASPHQLVVQLPVNDTINMLAHHKRFDQYEQVCPMRRASAQAVEAEFDARVILKSTFEDGFFANSSEVKEAILTIRNNSTSFNHALIRFIYLLQQLSVRVRGSLVRRIAIGAIHSNIDTHSKAVETLFEAIILRKSGASFVLLNLVSHSNRVVVPKSRLTPDSS